MPHHQSEEEAPSNLTDKIAQHSKDSTASDHPNHDENKGAFKTASEAIQGNPGPQIVEKASDAPKPKGKEELQAEAKKLNE